MKPVLMFITILVSFQLNQQEGWAFSVPDFPPGLQIQNLQSPLVSKKELEAGVPPPPTNSEHTLSSPNLTLKLAFMADPRLFPYDLECHIQDKTIALTGVVSREEEKALATQLTNFLLRGKDIQNDIEVQPSLSAHIQTTSDARLTELVKQRFAKSQTLRETNFEVSTLRGVVSLSGQTRFQVIALEAAQAAREIPGVIAVNTGNVQLEAADE